ncbi:hypothetical protein C0993_009522 [Termitomyces sp. T159_Od127]|nr:hypothetical protein C0993_009522 [Termitomyces sp. T159_Od127]
MSSRDPEFVGSLDGFTVSSVLVKEPSLPEEKRLRVAIMHMGAPAGGLNEATRAAVRDCLQQGHTLLAIQNGFPDLLDDNVIELSWLGVDSWMARGGSKLGTNRTLPSIDLGAVASTFQKFSFDALMIIGGSRLSTPCSYWRKAGSITLRSIFQCLGSDTSLNTLVDGATPSNIVLVLQEIVCLSSRRKEGSADTLLRWERWLNEVASSVYTTEVPTYMFKEEGASCMSFIERHHALLQAQPTRTRRASAEGAAVITIQSSSIKWVPVQEMVKHADMKNRRGKESW